MSEGNSLYKSRVSETPDEDPRDGLRCPICNETLHAYEEWVLRSGLDVGEPVEDGDYVHKECSAESSQEDERPCKPEGGTDE